MKRFLLILSFLLSINGLFAQYSDCATAGANAAYDVAANTCNNGPHSFLMGVETASGFFDAAAYVPDCDLGSINTVDLWFKITAFSTNIAVEMNSPSTGHNIMIFDAATIDCVTPINTPSPDIACFTKSVAGADYFATCGDPLIVGNDYYVVITMPAGTQEDITDLCFTTPVTVNEDPCGAIALTNAVLETGSTFCTTQNVDLTTCANDENQVWYTYTPPVGSNGFTITTSGMGTTGAAAVAVYTMSNCNTLADLELIGVEECDAYLTNIEVNCTTDGQTYYIAVSTTDALSGDFTIQVDDILDTTCHANDDCGDAIDLEADPNYVAAMMCQWQTLNLYCNLDACPEVDPTACNFDANPTVWFEITAPPTAELFSVEIQGTTLNDPTVGVFDENGCAGGYTETNVGTSCGQNPAMIEDITITGGNTYYILVGTQGSQGGSFNVLVKFDNPPDNDECANLETLTDGVSLVAESTECATQDVTSNSICNLADYEQSVWYTFTTGANTYKASINVVAGAVGTPAGGVAVLLLDDVCPPGSPTVFENACVFGDNEWCVLPSTTYNVLVTSSAVNAGTFDITYTDITTLGTNDECANATNIMEGAANTLVGETNDCATDTNDFLTACPTDDDANVWYEFTTDADDQKIKITLTNLTFTGNANLVVIENCGDATDIYNSCDAANDTNSFCVEPNTQYWIQIGTADTNTGTFDITVESVDETGVSEQNDICSNAKQLNGGVPITSDCLVKQFSSGNIGGCNETFTLGTCDFDVIGNPTVWYEFTTDATADLATVTLSNLVGGPFNIALYDNTCPTPTAISTCGNAPDYLQDVPVDPNTTYLVIVSSTSANEGTYSIDISVADLPGNDQCDNAPESVATPVVFGTTLNGETNICATDINDYAVPGCNLSDYEANVWYEFTTGATDQKIRITITNVSLLGDATMIVFDDCNGANEIYSTCDAVGENEFCTVANTTYKVQLGTSDANTGDFDILIENIDETVDQNDVCDNVQQVNGGTALVSNCEPFTYAGSNLDACSEDFTLGGCNFDMGPTVWYEFTTDADAKFVDITFENGTGTETVALYNSDCSALAAISGCESANPYIEDQVVTPATTYYILVGNTTGTGGAYDLLITVENPPENDDCISADYVAHILTDGVSLNDETTACATADIKPVCAGGTDVNTVWYEYTVPAGVKTVSIDINQADFATVYLVAVDGCNSVNYYDNDNTNEYCGPEGAGLLTIDCPTEGDVIFFSVGSAQGEEGEFDILLNETAKDPACTANDDCINAEILAPDAGLFCDWQPFNGNCNLTACPENFTAGPCNYDQQPYVWYEVTIPADVTLMDVRISGAIFGDVAFGVFNDFDCMVAPTEAAAGSGCVSVPAGTPEFLNIAVVPGNKYYIAIGSMNTDGGDFNFDIRFTLAPPNDDPCAAADIPVLIDGTALVDQSNICATQDITTGGCDPNQESSVWYYYTIPAGDNGFKVTVTGAGANPIAAGDPLSIVVVETTGCNAAVFEAEECTTEGEVVSFPCLDEGVYAIMIATSEDNEGEFEILLEALPEDPACIDNDLCANADADAFDNIMTDDPNGETCITDCNQDACPENWSFPGCDFNLEEAVWYSITTDATPDASMNVNLTSGEFNPMMAILESPCADPPTEAAAGSGCISGDGTTAIFNNMDVDPNTTYFIVVAPSATLDGGEFTLCVEITTSCNDDPCSPVAISAGVTNDPDNDCTTNTGASEDFVYDGGGCPDGTLGEASVYFTYQAEPGLESFEIIVATTGADGINGPIVVTAMEYDANNCGFMMAEIVGQECGDVATIHNTEVECPIAGNLYLIQVSSPAGDGQGDFSIEIIENMSSVANDACENAELVNIDVFCEFVDFAGDNTDACPEGFMHPVCTYEDGYFVWYEVTIPPGVENMDVQVVGSAGILEDPVFAVISSACGVLPALTVPMGDCVSGGLDPELLNIAVIAGNTYYILVGSEADREGPFTLRVKMNKPPENDECPEAISIPVGGSEIGTTECASDSQFPFSTCPMAMNESDVWYEIPLTINDEIVAIDINGFTGDGNFAAQVYWTTSDCGALTPAEESGQLLENCGSDKHFEFSIKCLDPMPTSLYVKIGSPTNDGDPDNGAEQGMFNISVTPAVACPYADECGDAETFMSDTPNDCADSNNFIDIPGCLEFACPDDAPGNCEMNDGPTVWFQIEIDSDEATKLITQVTAPGFDAVWSVYKGTSCDDMALVAEQLVVNGVTQTYNCSNSDSDPNNIFQIALEAMSASNGVLYWVAVTAIGTIDDPNFTLTYASALPCLACSGVDGFDCANGDFEASIEGEVVLEEDYNNFCQGEEVEVCLEFNYNTTGSSNDWFHGFVPSFGPGWDLEASDLENQSIGGNFEFHEPGDCGAYLNGYDLPNVCTYFEDGILKLCNVACNPGGCPCDGGMEAGDPLPAGWWYSSSGGSPTCGSACTPSDNYGWPSGTNVDVSICLDLIVKEFDDPSECEENKSLMIVVQTFSDAISGCWDDANPCVIDPSFQGPAWEINCNVPPDPVITPNPDEICSGDAFNVTIGNEAGTNLEISVEVEDNPNVTGEMDYTIWGQETIGDPLINLGTAIEIVYYFVTVIDPEIECESPKDTLQVIVYPDIQISFNEPLGICEDATEPIQVCATAMGGTGTIATYEWDTGETGSCIMVQPTTTTQYCVTVTDDFGCTGEECVEVVVSPVIVPTLEPTDYVICQSDGGEIEINLLVTGGTPVFDFNWILSTGLVGDISFDGYTYTVDVENSLNILSPHIISVEITDAAGCTGFAETTFNLVDSPTLISEIISAPCSGSSGDVELSITTVSGINGYPVGLITIYNCDGIQLEQIIGSEANPITVPASECYFIEAEDTWGCTAYDTINMNEGSVEVPVLSGIEEICYVDGVAYTLTLDNAASYSSYEWSTTETTSSITVMPDSADTYIYKVTVTTDGCTDIGEHTVVVYDSPDIILSGSTSFCTGSSTTIDVGGDPDTWTYTWTDPSGSPVVGDTSSLTINIGGDYNVTVTDENGCTNTETISILEDDELAPVIPQMNMCDSDSITIDAGPGFATYSWSFNGADLSNTEQFLRVGEPGEYCVTVTDIGGCDGDTCMTVNQYDSPVAVLDTAIVYNSTDQASCFTTLNFNDFISGDAGIFTDCNNIGIDIADITNVDFVGRLADTLVFCYTTNTATAPCTDVAYDFIVIVKDCICPSVDLLSPPDMCNSVDTLDLDDKVKNTNELGSWKVSDGPGGQDLSGIIYNGVYFVSTELIAGTYEVEFTLTNPIDGCPPSNSVMINVSNSPRIMISDTIPSCNKGGQSTPVIHDLDDYVTGDMGVWTVQQNPGAVDVSGLPNLNFTDINTGLYSFKFCTTTAVEPCEDVCDILYIRVVDCSCPPTQVRDTMVCNDSGIIDLDALITTSTDGHWVSGAVDVSNGTFEHAGLDSATYIVVYEYDNPIPGCEDKFPLNIVVFDQPWATVNGAEACGNDPSGTEVTTVELDHLVVDGYEDGTWTEIDGLGIVIPADGIIDFEGLLTPEQMNQSYTFVYTLEGNGSCDGVTYEVEIQINDCNCFPLQLNQIEDMCNDGAVPFNLEDYLSPSTGEGTWAINPALTITGGNQLNVDGATEGTYTVVFTLDNQKPGCPQSDSVSFEVFGPRWAGVGSTAELCDGEEQIFNLFDLLTDNPDAGGEWSSSSTTGFDAVNGTFTTNGLTSDSYTFEYSFEANGECTGSTATVVVKINPLPTVDAGVDKSIDCDHPSVTLDGSGSSTGLSYQWYNANGPITGATSMTYNAQSGGTYTLEVTDPNTNCINTDEVLVNSTDDLPVFDIEGVDPLCYNETNGSVSIQNLSGGDGNYQYQLNGGAFGNQDSWSNLASGNYDITVKDGLGCSATVSLVLVNPALVTAEITPKSHTITLGNDEWLKLVNPESHLEHTITWTENDSIICTNEFNPCDSINVSPSSTTSYCVEVVDKNGCLAKDCIQISAQRIYNTYIPTVFTPGSSKGEISTFYMSDNEGIKKIVHFSIFSRWGERVFTTANIRPNDPSVGWDGKYKGKYVNPAVYIYLIEVIYDDNTEESFTGDVTVIR